MSVLLHITHVNLIKWFNQGYDNNESFCHFLSNFWWIDTANYYQATWIFQPLYNEINMLQCHDGKHNNYLVCEVFPYISVFIFKYMYISSQLQVKCTI